MNSPSLAEHTQNLDLPCVVRQEPFGWLPLDLRREARVRLAGPLSRGRGRLVYRDLPLHLRSASVDGRKHIIFLSYYPHPSITKKSMVLRASGEYYTTLISACVREDAKAECHFDQVYEARDYRDLMAVLEDARPAAFHAFIHHWLFGAIAVEKARGTSSRVVIEINDSFLHLRSDPKDSNTRAEGEILRRADAFTHRMPQPAITELRRAFGLSQPDEEIQSLPYRDIFESRGKSLPGRRPRLVFAGGVMPRHIALERGHEGHLFDPFIETVCSQSCELSFLVNLNARDMHWHEHSRYFELERKFPNFSFRQGVPFFELPKLLCEFDYGIYWENRAASSYGDKHFKYNMATKIFSYLEGGLPLLVPKSAERISDFVLAHDLGVVYESDLLGQIASDLGQVDYPRLVARVEEYRAAHDMSTALDACRRLYSESAERR